MVQKSSPPGIYMKTLGFSWGFQRCQPQLVRWPDLPSCESIDVAWIAWKGWKHPRVGLKWSWGKKKQVIMGAKATNWCNICILYIYIILYYYIYIYIYYIKYSCWPICKQFWVIKTEVFVGPSHLNWLFWESCHLYVPVLCWFYSFIYYNYFWNLFF